MSMVFISADAYFSSSAYIRLVANQDITGGLYDLDTEDEAWITVYNRQPGLHMLFARSTRLISDQGSCNCKAEIWKG